MGIRRPAFCVFLFSVADTLPGAAVGLVGPPRFSLSGQTRYPGIPGRRRVERSNMSNRTIPARTAGGFAGLLYRLAGALALALALAAAHGCAERAPASAGPPPRPPALDQEPIGVQLVRVEPRLTGQPFQVLMDFERALDEAFLAAPGQAAVTAGPAHTGRSAGLLPPAPEGQGPRREIGIKLSSVLGPGKFPGRWALAGAYFLADAPGTVTIAVRDPAGGQPFGRRAVPLLPGRWTPVFLDLAAPAVPVAEAASAPTTGGPALLDARSTAGPTLLTFEVAGGGAVRLDDVLATDNERTFVDSTSNAGTEGTGLPGWAVKRRGLASTVAGPRGLFALRLQTPEASPDGWTCEEANELWARFSTAGGGWLTVFCDGRQVRDGALTLLFNPAGTGGGPARLFAAQHATPADLDVPEDLGRVDRGTDGDANNDGYNERRGTYQVMARGPRLEVRITPRTPVLGKPILEISGMPAGKPLVTVEGRLVETTARATNGNLLVLLPIAIERPTTVNVSVR